jgi:hypothetical protein
MNSAVVLEIRRICDVAEIARVVARLTKSLNLDCENKGGGLTCRFALSSYRGVANLAHRNKVAETSLMLVTESI